MQDGSVENWLLRRPVGAGFQAKSEHQVSRYYVAGDGNEKARRICPGMVCFRLNADPKDIRPARFAEFVNG
ncbi:Uncharacterized protein MLTONO_p0227 (plasmid) [Mesorhizobium loti]|nr:Uncharacterized protein MLTONO_p0227 [Mesorhizobium loti]